MRCPACGAPVDPEQDFCMECAEPIAQAKVVDVPSSPPPRAPPPVKARPKWKREEEPEPVRCPGCGIPTRRARCPGCGVRLREED